jgi:hypothetical protein
MLAMPEGAPGGEVIEALFDYMSSVDMTEQFEEFVMRAMWSDEELASDVDETDESDDTEYCVTLQPGELVVQGDTLKGLIVSVWPTHIAPAADSIPECLNRDRHARFLFVEDDLIAEIYLLPDDVRGSRTLH